MKQCKLSCLIGQEVKAELGHQRHVSGHLHLARGHRLQGRGLHHIEQGHHRLVVGPRQLGGDGPHPRDGWWTTDETSDLCNLYLVLQYPGDTCHYKYSNM